MRNLTKAGFYISNRIGKAIADYDLIEDKDRILVGVSGGKDSIALLHLLNERKKWAPVSYDLVAMHIESDHLCGSRLQKKVLKDYFKKNGIEHHFKKIRIKGDKRGVSCFWCSWNRRKELFLAADRLGCNKIALGHHMDDINETLLLNMFYHGEFSAMNPRQELFKGKVVIIRPLVYVEEKHTRAFAKELKFKTEVSKCPYAETTKRRLMKDLIAKVEEHCEFAKLNLFRSVGRINREYTQIKDMGGEGPAGSKIQKGRGVN